MLSFAKKETTAPAAPSFAISSNSASVTCGAGRDYVIKLHREHIDKF